MNWASSKAGASLVDFSSELDECPASNVLDDNLSTIWLSEEGFPQWLCISLANLKHVDNLVIRTIGWNCWHSYITNPKIVSMHVSHDGSKFKMWDSFEVTELTRGTQLFSCAPVDSSMYPFIAFEVTQTFGGSQTYMNRVFLYSDEVTASPSSSKGGQSTISDADSEYIHSSSINVSELSGRTPEKEQSNRVSNDTEQLVEQLQNALGLRSGPDDSNYSDDLEDSQDVSAVRNDYVDWVHLDASPATVASRLTSLEHTVQTLEQTVLNHSKVNEIHGVSFARSPTPPSRSQSRSHSPATSQSSDRHGLQRKNGSVNPDRIDQQRVADVTDRLGAIEEKFSRLLDTLEAQPRAPVRPPPPPPPPAQTTPSSSYSLMSSIPRTKSSLAQNHMSSLRSNSFAQQQLHQSAASMSNATISTKSPSLIAEKARTPQPSPTRLERDATERAMEQVVRSVETMMHRVLAQHEHKQRVLSIDSSINSSSVLGSADATTRQRFSADRPRSRSRSTSRTRSERSHLGGHARSPDSLAVSDVDFVAKSRRSRSGRDIGDYISRKASRLLLEKRQREEIAQNEEKLANGRRELPVTAKNRPIPHNRIRAAMQDRAHSRIRSDSATPISNRDSDSDVADSEPQRMLLEKKSVDDRESHNILERSIFELLKSKYGFGTSTEGRAAAGASTPPPHSLPMRVPLQPSHNDSAVVDWPEYVKNRVASNCGSGSRNGSPLRHSHAAINTDALDVLPRARQSLRDGRRERERQQAVSLDRSLSPLNGGPHSVDGLGTRRALPDTLPGTADIADGMTAKLPAWCAQDAEMAELVRTLHEKVYQRTIKEAQYDMMLLVPPP